MELSVSLGDALSLTIADRPTADEYPTARLQKGLLLSFEGRDLAEEGVGFGVPVLKRGALTVFPGRMQLAERRGGPHPTITATYQMDLVERLAGTEGQGPTSRSFYTARDLLAALHRRMPPLRGPLTAMSNTVRRRRGWVTTFAETSTVATLTVTYAVDADDGCIRVAVDVTELAQTDVTELVVMNELGARGFDLYLDSDGARLRGREIGSWAEVPAARACFASSAAGVAFCVGQVAGAKLYRGWELLGSRLAWAGFGYSLHPATEGFSYEVRIERAP